MWVYRRKNYLEVIFYLVLTAAFLVRVVDLNYNAPFNDEAIYIVVGRMGLFASDWWSYGARIWMAGLPYIYPTLTALAYQTGGILGSRMVNVFFGTLLIEEVYRLTKLVNLFDEKTNTQAALVAAFISAFSAVGIYVSKLATYDMLSFLLLIMSINCFLKSGHSTNGKYYFLAALTIFAAFLTKIVAAIFYPPLLIMSIILIMKRTHAHRITALKYFYLPLILSVLIYVFFNLNYLVLYIQTHQEIGSRSDIFNLIWLVCGGLLLLSLVALLILNRPKFNIQTIALFILALVIPAFHLAVARYATLDKHLYLSVIFLAVLAGYVINRLKFILAPVAIVVGIFYAITSYQQLYAMEHTWSSSRKAEQFFHTQVSDNARVLTENGGAVILDLYDKTFPPTNIVTFDWINYSGLSGDQAYLQAVRDEYFDYIELDGQSETKKNLVQNIRQEMQGNYKLLFSDGNFEIYGRQNQVTAAN